MIAKHLVLMMEIPLGRRVLTSVSLFPMILMHRVSIQMIILMPPHLLILLQQNLMSMIPILMPILATMGVTHLVLMRPVLLDEPSRRASNAYDTHSPYVDQASFGYDESVDSRRKGTSIAHPSYGLTSSSCHSRGHGSASRVFIRRPPQHSYVREPSLHHYVRGPS